MQRPKFRFFFLLFAGLIAITGCTSSHVALKPSVSVERNQDSFFSDGREVLVSFGDHTTISVASTMYGREVWLQIYCANVSGDRLDLDPSQITARGANRWYLSGFPLPVRNPDKYMRSQRNLQAVLLGLQAFSQAVVISSTRSEVASALRERDSRERLNETAVTMENINRTTERGLLRRNTLFPGDAVVGNVIISRVREGHRTGEGDPPLADVFWIRIPVGPDVHEIELRP
jgi:hypothetical protein